MKITIKDVAKKAGVSVATVSRVLNAKDRVKPQTRQAVQAAIEAYNFKPDPIARTMINKQTRTIGFLVSGLSNEYWGTVAEQLQQALWQHRYSLAIHCHFGDAGQEAAQLEALIERRVDGIILCGTAPGALMRKLRHNDIPVVCFGSAIAGAGSVEGDHVQGAHLAVAHLALAGHREIGYISCGNDPESRESGYRHALLDASLPVREERIRRPSSQQLQLSFSARGFAVTEQLLADKVKFTALFCYNDLVAIGAMRALEEAGIRVPEQVAVVGYDDISQVKYFKPALTTVRQPVPEMSQAAVDMMLELLNNRKQTPRRVLFQMSLVVRESCGRA